jgi:hypothetical protein
LAYPLFKNQNTFLIILKNQWIYTKEKFSNDLFFKYLNDEYEWIDSFILSKLQWSGFGKLLNKKH